MNDTSVIDYAYHQERVLTQTIAQDAERERLRPCFIYAPLLTIDGDQWCAMYGNNLQDGVAGFGSSPAAAMLDFDKHWLADLPARVVWATEPSPPRCSHTVVNTMSESSARSGLNVKIRQVGSIFLKRSSTFLH